MGFKVLGAFVGTNEYVMSALREKMKATESITKVMLRFPNAQARHYLHRFCCSDKINYWMRSYFPTHAAELMEDVIEQ